MTMSKTLSASHAMCDLKITIVAFIYPLSNIPKQHIVLLTALGILLLKIVFTKERSYKACVGY